MTRTGKARLPEGVTWPQLLAVSAVAGVGFTMSLFISELAFSDHRLVSEAKVALPKTRRLKTSSDARPSFSPSAPAGSGRPLPALHRR